MGMNPVVRIDDRANDFPKSRRVLVARAVLFGKRLQDVHKVGPNRRPPCFYPWGRSLITSCSQSATYDVFYRVRAMALVRNDAVGHFMMDSLAVATE